MRSSLDAEPDIIALKERAKELQRFAERLAAAMDPARFGVRAAYLFGSTDTGSPGPASDIDLLFAFEGSANQRHDLDLWLEGWSLCLAEVTFKMLGLPASGLLNARILVPPRAAAEVQAALGAGHPMRALPPGTVTTS